jgi:CYTH domain-containing protein
MNQEIERKFLVNKSLWKKVNKPEGLYLKQTYLSTNPDKTIRVRVLGEKGFITLKGRAKGLIRPEFEYEVPLEDAIQMIDLFGETVIEKTRYEINFKNHLWEIDVFDGANKGLIVAEIELTSETEKFVKPDWLSKEVSEEPKYFNANLQETPYNEW